MTQTDPLGGSTEPGAESDVYTIVLLWFDVDRARRNAAELRVLGKTR